MMPVKCWSSLSCVSRFSRSINLHLSRPPDQHPNQRREYDAFHGVVPVCCFLPLTYFASSPRCTTYCSSAPLKFVSLA